MIEPINYPTDFLSPAFFVKKPRDKQDCRFMSDMTMLNRNLQRVLHPIHNPSDIWKLIPTGTKWFAGCDMGPTIS